MPYPKTKTSKGRGPRQRQARTKEKSSGEEIILLAVTGMSPAILTETIWALAHEEPPVLPDRIVVVTTGAGKEQIIQELFTPQQCFNNQSGWDCLLCTLQELGHDTRNRLRFDPESDDLRVLTRWEEGSRRKPPLSDIRTAADNEAVADTILELVRGIVEKLDTQLVASIAGGRKTMGTLLYACMTLIGRETDRITHVLVDEPFDDPRLQPRFYFPAQPQAELTTPQNERVLAKDARIVLADLPFVPVRNLFAKDLGRMPGGFMALAAQCSNEVRKRAAADLKLVLHRSRPIIEVNGVAIKLSPKEQFIVLFLAERARQQEPAFSMYKEAPQALKRYLQELKRGIPGDSSDWRDLVLLPRSDKGEFDEQQTEKEIRRALSDVRKKLKAKAAGAMALLPFLPEAGRLSIDLLPNQITVTD